jgi:hypothetical protein
MGTLHGRELQEVGKDAQASVFEEAVTTPTIDPGRYGLISASAHCATIVISVTHQCVERFDAGSSC